VLAEKIKIIDDLFQQAIEQKIEIRDSLSQAFDDHKGKVYNYGDFWQGQACDLFISRYMNERVPRYQAIIVCLTSQIEDMKRILREKHANDERLASFAETAAEDHVRGENSRLRRKQDVRRRNTRNSQEGFIPLSMRSTSESADPTPTPVPQPRPGLTQQGLPVVPPHHVDAVVDEILLDSYDTFGIDISNLSADEVRALVAGITASLDNNRYFGSVQFYTNTNLDFHYWNEPMYWMGQMMGDIHSMAKFGTAAAQTAMTAKALWATFKAQGKITLSTLLPSLGKSGFVGGAAMAGTALSAIAASAASTTAAGLAINAGLNFNENQARYAAAKDASSSGGTQEAGNTSISSDMETKILEGQRKVATKNELTGGHSSNINNANPNYAVEQLSVNPDGTRVVKFTTLYPDGNLSKIKKSTIFPDTWSDASIIEAVKTVGNKPAIGIRARDGATLHRSIVNGVEIEVIKIGNNVTSGYPTGGGVTGILSGFLPPTP